MIELFCAKHGTAKASAPKWNREAIHSVTINRTGQCSDQTTNYLANFTNCFLVTISRRFSIPIEVTSSGEVKLKKNTTFKWDVLCEMKPIDLVIWLPLTIFYVIVSNCVHSSLTSNKCVRCLVRERVAYFATRINFCIESFFLAFQRN